MAIEPQLIGLFTPGEIVIFGQLKRDFGPKRAIPTRKLLSRLIRDSAQNREQSEAPGLVSGPK